MKRARILWLFGVGSLGLSTWAHPAWGWAGQDTYQPRPRGSVTFSEHVAPILFQHCTPCHRSGQSGPFPLTNYQEARRRGRLLGMVAKDGFMPPWLPEAGHLEFSNSRALSAEEIGLLGQWARDGRPLGKEEEVPPLPDFAQEWPLGSPDQVVEANEVFEMPADEVGIVRNFTFDVDLNEDRWLRAVGLGSEGSSVLRALLFPHHPEGDEVEPGDLSVVLERPKELSFWPLAGLGGEIVETTPWPYPEGTALHLAKGTSLLLQVYFEPTGESETVHPRLGLYFAPTPPSRTLVTASLGTRSLELPAGESTYTVESSFTLPVPVEVMGIVPHAHRIARELEASATLPDGTSRTLLVIKKWDFTWQQSYWYEQPVLLPAGSVVEMHYLYDNSDENENNPNYPAQAVEWGQTLKGEMAGLHLRLVVDKKKDLRKLKKAYDSYLREAGL